MYSTVVSEVYRQLSNSPATRGRGVTLIVWSLPSSVPKRRSGRVSQCRGDNLTDLHNSSHSFLTNEYSRKPF